MQVGLMHGVLLLSVLGLAGEPDPKPAAPQASETTDASDYQIGAGDQLKIVVHGEHSGFNQQEFTVGGRGSISFPYIGMVAVDGLTPFEVEDAIRARLAGNFILDPQVTVHVQAYKSQTVDVMGAVKNPGVYSLEGPTTVRTILAEAGSVDAEQSSGYVVITRGEERHRFSLDDLEKDHGEFRLQNDDVVEIERGKNIFLAGEVARPGPVSFVQGITASQALIMAGGGSEFGRLSGAYVIRGEERISINLKRVMRGKAADLSLKPGDRLVVPVSPL